MIQVVPELQQFNAYFGTIAQILPKREHDAPIQGLMLVAEHGGDTMPPKMHPGEMVPTTRKKRARYHIVS